MRRAYALPDRGHDTRYGLPMTDAPGRQRLDWRQFILPVVVLVLVFGWLLPNLIDYALVWDAMTSLPGRAALLLLLVGMAWTFVESGIYTSLIPGLGVFPGWRAFMGGNTIAGFAPTPWDMLVRYGMYRGFGVDPSAGGASIIVGGMFTLGIKYLAPAIVLVAVVLSGGASSTLTTIAVIYAGLLVVIVLVVSALVSRESWAAWAGRLLQRLSDWAFGLVKRSGKQDIEAGLVSFRTTVVTTLSSRWQQPALYVVASHAVQFLGMLYIFRQLGIGPEVVSTVELLGTYGLGIFMSMMPIVPGGLGAVEVTYVWVLARDDDALADVVAAAAFTHRVFFWVLPIIVGVWPLAGWLRAGGSLAGLGKGEATGDAGSSLGA